MSRGLVTMIDDRLPKTRRYTKQSPVVEEVTYLMERLGNRLRLEGLPHGTELVALGICRRELVREG